jgi:leucyl-tRNA synthetase
VLLLAPFAPHLAEELWEKLGHSSSLTYEPWPTYDPAKTVTDTVEVILQVNGKLRSRLMVPVDTAEEELEKMARSDESVSRFTAGKTVVKAIVVKNKLVNLVVR